MGFRRGWLLAVLLVVGVIGCGAPLSEGPSTEPSGTTPPSSEGVSSTSAFGDARIVEALMTDTLGTPPAGFTVEDGVARIGAPAVQLAHVPLDRLAGMRVPHAVPTSDGSIIYYTMWEGVEAAGDPISGVPVVRRVEVATGADEVFRRGAYAVAVSVDGRVGYVAMLNGAYRSSGPNPTRVMVASSDAASDEVWSGEGDFVTVGWAGSTLLAYEIDEGEYPRTFAFYGPGESRLLSDGGVVVSISPDGTGVLLVELGPAGYTHFVLVDAADGAVLASADFTTALGPLHGSYAGDWVGERIVVGPGVGDGDRYPYVHGFAILTYRDNVLSLERLLALRGVAGVVSVTSPRFTPEGHVWLRVTTTTNGGVSYNYYDAVCDPGRAICQPVSLLRPDTMENRTPIMDNSSGGTQP